MAKPQTRRPKVFKKSSIAPIILAAGKTPRLGFSQALARFGERSALEIAVENCAGLARPIVVVGYRAAEVRAAAPHRARVVVHRGWRSGQLSSLRAGLRRVPRSAPFLLYPVDHPLLTPVVIRRLVAAFERRGTRHSIVMPIFRGRRGHPVIFSSVLRDELAHARTAREVVERDPRRVKLVRAPTSAVVQDYGTPAAYRRCQRTIRRQR